MPFSISPILAGIDVTKVDATQVFPLGSKAFMNDGSEYLYVQNNLSATATQFYTYIIDPNFKLTAAVSHSNGGSGAKPYRAGVVQTSNTFTDQYFGWVAIKGPMTCKFSGNTAVNAKIYTSATAGELDDGSASQTLIGGLYVNTSVAASATGVAFANIELAINSYTTVSSS